MMKQNIRFLVLVFLVMSCSDSKQRFNCDEIEKIEIYSISYTINFPTQQFESNVRGGMKRIITDKSRLSKIDSLFKNLNSPNNDELSSLVGVCDVFCKNGIKYKVSIDNWKVKIGQHSFDLTEDIKLEVLEVVERGNSRSDG